MHLGIVLEHIICSLKDMHFIFTSVLGIRIITFQISFCSYSILDSKQLSQSVLDRNCYPLCFCLSLFSVHWSLQTVTDLVGTAVRKK